MSRVVTPEVWKAIGLVAEQHTTAELVTRELGVYPDAKLDALILAARAVHNDDEPI